MSDNQERYQTCGHWFDKARMEQALSDEKIKLPRGLTMEEKREFIKANSCKNELLLRVRSALGSDLPSMGEVVLTWGSHTIPVTAYRVSNPAGPRWLLATDDDWLCGVTHWAKVPEKIAQ